MTVDKSDLRLCADALSGLAVVESANVTESPSGNPELVAILSGREIPPQVSDAMSVYGVSVNVPRTGTRGDPTTVELVGQ